MAELEYVGWYFKDWLTSRFVRSLPEAWRSRYLDMLCNAADDRDCGLLDDPKSLALAAGVSVKEWGKMAETFKEVWIAHPTVKGKVHNPKMYSVWLKCLETKEAKSRAGRASAEARKQQRSNDVPTALEQCCNSVPTKGREGKEREDTLVCKSEGVGVTAGGSDAGETASRNGAEDATDAKEPGPEAMDRPRDARKPHRAIQAGIWRQACLCAETIEGSPSEQECVGVGGQIRAFKIACWIEANPKDGEKANRALLRARISKDPEVRAILDGLRKYPDGAWPGNGREQAEGTFQPSRLRVLIKKLGGGPLSEAEGLALAGIGGRT